MCSLTALAVAYHLPPPPLYTTKATITQLPKNAKGVCIPQPALMLQLRLCVTLFPGAGFGYAVSALNAGFHAGTR